MATKPTPGGSDGTYGTELNAFLDVSLASDGKVKTEALQTDSTAPTADAALTNKKYVDDQDATRAFSAYTNEDSESNTMLISTGGAPHSYLAQTDGFVVATISIAGVGFEIKGYVGDSDDPVGAGDLVGRAEADGTNSGKSVFFAVASGEFFEITVGDDTTASILWKSMGTLSKPVDQG